MTHPDAGDATAPLSGRVMLMAAMGAYAILVTGQAFSLPDRVPGHIGPSGEVTRWGSLAGHLWTMGLTGAGLGALFWFLPALVDKLPRDLVNLPHKDYWMHPDRWPTARRRLANDMGWLGAGVLLFLGYALWMVGQHALGDPPPITVFWAGVVPFGIGTLGWAAFLQFGRRWRPPPGAGD